MPKSRIMIQLEPETIEQVDKIRGAVPRAAWVRLLIEDRLRGGEYVGISPQQFPSGTWGEGATFTEVSVERAREGMAAEERASVAERPEKAVRQLRDADKPKRKPKACKHEDPIRKLGRPYCTDCGEFV